jgi:Domain of unknown function (DUF1844)
MSEREGTSYKVTDRRKYNPDGTPREATESGAPVADEAETQIPLREQPGGNVLNFPGDAATKQPQPAASPGPAVVVNDQSATGPASTAAPPTAGQVEQAYNQTRGPQSSRLPEASFLSLANMLAVEAAMHLGLIQSPGEEAPPADMEAARHLIDMLGMLQSKTSGNLTGEEDNLLENILADLRMQFVAISNRRLS